MNDLFYSITVREEPLTVNRPFDESGGGTAAFGEWLPPRRRLPR